MSQDRACYGAHNGRQMGRVGRQTRVRCHTQPTESVELSGLCLACTWPCNLPCTRPCTLHYITSNQPQCNSNNPPASPDERISHLK